MTRHITRQQMSNQTKTRRCDMRYARRFIATLITVAIWGIATISDAFALLPDPPGVGVGVGAVAPHPATTAGTPLWEFAMVAALTALLVFAVVGLIASLRRTRPASRPSPMLHA
jgi:hypothetical protein